MNSTFMRVLAVLLAIGAIVMAWSGYRMSAKSSQAVSAHAPAPSYPQVVAMRDLPSGILLTAHDVQLVSMAQRDPHGFDSIADIAGKLTIEPVKQGAPLLASDFAVLGPAAQSLHAGERGVAIKVNEVIGAGGFVSPGDHVDVLLYLRADRETANASSAQVVLQNVRVLAYGENLGQAQPSMLQNLMPEGKPAGLEGVKKADKKPVKDVRAALLAVPEKDAARLMLADSSGLLRLALRGAEPLQSAQVEDKAHFMRLDEITRPTVPAIIATEAARPVVHKVSAKMPRSRPASDKPSQVIVHQGDKVEIVQLSR